jgi:hypothetical protein
MAWLCVRFLSAGANLLFSPEYAIFLNTHFHSGECQRIDLNATEREGQHPASKRLFYPRA